MRFLFSVLALLGATGSAAASDGTIPTRFHGEWAVRLTDCRSRGGENTQGMTIGARTIRRYEESVKIKRVTVLGRDNVRYEGILLHYDGEVPAGDTLRLSPDGARLLEAGFPDGPDRKASDLLRCAR
jgi:hypothetical protein